MGNTNLFKTELFANRYELQEKIGSGGMGVIHRAKDRLTGKLVALKQLPQAAEFILTTSLSDSDSTTARIALAREFEILSAMHHPHIIQVQDYGFSNGEPYFTMTLLEDSQDIKSYAQNCSFEEKIDLILQVLESLAYLHQRGILHHDIKPSNILVKDDHTYLLDFGLSIEHGLHHLRIAGTVTYLAPEIILHKASSIASDLYSIGVVLYEIITGERPYQSRRISDLVEEIVNGTPDFNQVSKIEYGDLPSELPLLNIPYDGPTGYLKDEPTQPVDYEAEALQWIDMETLVFEDGFFLSPIAKIVKRLLSKRPEDRYGDAKAVIDALNDALKRPNPVESKDIRESYLQSAHFVGREDELNQLTDALLATLSGEGSTWLIAGESGVGKSRLVNEVERLAKVWGATVLKGKGERFSHLPYHYWREPLRRFILLSGVSELEASILKNIVPDINDLLLYDVPDTEELAISSEDQRLIFTIADLFGRNPNPLVIILEDLHWANESLRILKAIHAQIKDIPVLVLATYQTEVKPNLPQELLGANSVHLNRFNKAEITELVDAILGKSADNTQVVEFLSHKTAGNAFFIVETLRALAEETGELRKITRAKLPQDITTSGIQAAIMMRLMRYPAEFRSLLMLAAVMGRQLNTTVLKYILNTQKTIFETNGQTPSFEKWILTSANASILSLIDENWQFAHEKFREVLMDAIDIETTRNFHEIIARAYEETYPDNNDYAGILFYHWGQAQNLSKEIQYALATARQFLYISEHHDAIEYAQRALNKLSPDDEHHRACFTEVLGRANIEIGQHRKAAEYLELSITSAQKIGNKVLETKARTFLGWVYKDLGESAQAQATIERAIEIAIELQDEQLQADALVQYGAYWGDTGHIDKMKNSADQAIAIYKKHNNHAGLGRAYNLRCMPEFFNDKFAESKAYLYKSMESLKICGDRWMMALVHNNLGELCRQLDELDEGLENVGKALDIFQRLNSDWGVMLANFNFAEICINLKDPARMRPYLYKAHQIGLALDNLTFITSNLRLSANYFILQQQYDWAYKTIGLCLNYEGLRYEDRTRCEKMLDVMENVLDTDTVAGYLQEGAQLDIKEFSQNILNQLQPD